MDKQKQIEEMADIMCDCVNCRAYNELHPKCRSFIENEVRATKLYNAGYRKLDDHAIMVLRNAKGLEDKISKETAEKIADWLDNEKGYCGLGYLVKQKFCTEEKKND